ncbi:putative cytochrome P450 oxidoreductase [Xylariaceae sp. FL0804]|nr:putative cytochrome P450 oxidoreductase [Xylariaceae sp. FL0804]
MLSSPLTWIVAIAAAIVFDLARRRLAQAKNPLLPLPPGPPGQPLLGHLRVIPDDHPEYAYAKWGKEYDSDILHFNVLGRSIVVLNSVESARDLMDKKGAIYGDRPRFVLFEVMGWGVTLTFLRWSPRFKLHRKLLQQSFSQSACKAYRPIQEEEARRAARAIARRPQDWEMLLRQFSQAVVLRIGFGIDVLPEDDPYVRMAYEVEAATGEGGVPAASLVDFFPALRFAPSAAAALSGLFAPLAHARRTRPTIRNLHDAPWAAVEPLLRAGRQTPQPSFVGTHFGRYLANERAGRPNEATVADLKGAAGAISIAGGNTTWSTVVVCVLNLVLRPDAQARARAEIDAVLGDGSDGDGAARRLPTFEDRPRLPYLEHVIRETTRWAPLSPLGVPHATTAEDAYRGYRIPAGSVVYANAWAMSRDERHYSDPEDFVPERYLPASEGGRGEPFPEGAFGFGRRVCPGQYLALSGVYIIMATLLATMDIRCPVENGKEIRPSVSFSNGLSGVPDSFGCVFTPRSDRARSMLDESF